MQNWSIKRPLQTLTGSIYRDSTNLAERLCDALVKYLDNGDGWSWQDQTGLYSWVFGPLKAMFGWQTPPDNGCEVLRCDIVVTDRIQQINVPTLVHLNELNTHANGWFYWYDESTSSIISSSQIRVTQAEWFWADIFFGLIPFQVTSADAAASRLAGLAGGEIAARTHLEKGWRRTVDGWLIGTRLGPRDFTASMDLFTSALELKTMTACLSDLYEEELCFLDAPLEASISDDNGIPRWDFRRIWNPDQGWSWQWTTIDGFPMGSGNGDTRQLAELAAKRNSETGARLGLTSSTELGGWIANSAMGLVHTVTIDAMLSERLLNDARNTAGVLMAVVWMGLRRPVAEDCEPASPQFIFNGVSNLRTAGPIGWSYLLADADQPLYSRQPWSEEISWCVPRHSLVACWGTFNPMGPTISSLELTYTEDGVLVWWLLRHPHAPRIELLADIAGSRDDEQTWAHVHEAICSVLSVTDEERRILGSQPEFCIIADPTFTKPVVKGFFAFGEATQTEHDLRKSAAKLRVFSNDPWLRLSAEDPGEVDSENDAAAEWCSALLDHDVVAGHQLFMRSAWEGAKIVTREKGFELAQQISNELRYQAQDRALADYSFRNETPPLVRSAVGHVTQPSPDGDDLS